ncbi:MAG: bestrophin family ion channel [Bacteroidota bacterium]
MYVKRRIDTSIVIKFAWKNLLFFTIWALIVVWSYHYYDHKDINISIPFLPLSTIGIAVAFYVGFKNNSSYDRFWEARKIWGGIVNYSRSWGNHVLSFLSNHFAEGDHSEEIKTYQKELIYRHIAWINALRLQLRRPSSFSIKLKKSVRSLSVGQPERKHWDEEVGPFLDNDEYCRMAQFVNPATQLVRKQGETLRRMQEEKKFIDEFRYMEMMRMLEECYNLQGKCERIKNTPFPRQYAYFSEIFTWMFILLLPFGLVGEFAKMGHSFAFVSIPFSVLISWIFVTMEIVGDNSEDPFENFINDVPMTALCRTIEIDLREMLGETELPEKVVAERGILM